MSCDWKLVAKVVAIIDIIVCSVYAIYWLIGLIVFAAADANKYGTGVLGTAVALLLVIVLLLVLAILLLMATLDKFNKLICFIICVVWIVVSVITFGWTGYEAFGGTGTDFFSLVYFILSIVFIVLVVPFTVECGKAAL